MIELKQVKTNRQLTEFIEFPNKLYKGNAYYVPPLSLDERSNLSPEKNPAYDYCDAWMYMAYKDGKPVGRICALINKAYNEKWNRKCIRFTRWDVIDDFEVTQALFDKVFEIARQHDLNEVIGPIGFCDLDRQGLLVEGFEELSMFITIYNHPYYVKHLECLGFTKDVDWCEMQIFMPEKMDPRIEKIGTAMMKKLKLSAFKPKKKSDVKPYIPEIFEVVNKTYSHLYGVVPLTEKQITSYVKQYFPIINIDYLSLIIDQEGKLAAFGLAAPSFAKAMRSTGGHLFPFGWVNLLYSIKHHDVIDLYLIGVLPEYQGKGINAAILNEVMQRAKKNGVKMAETGPELELNDKIRTQWKGFETREHKRRRCFVKKLDD